jgi:CheY-like chemotaxis protein
MPNRTPIIIIDDDVDDVDITRTVIEEMNVKHPVISFSTSESLLTYLRDESNTVQPFIILSDVNLPGISGVELKAAIERDDRLRRKSIPFVFYSTSADEQSVIKAYEYKVQGYFVKESLVSEMKKTLFLIFDYWERCKHPNAS